MAKLLDLKLQYSIFTGPDFMVGNPIYIKAMISSAAKDIKAAAKNIKAADARGELKEAEGI